MSYYMHGTWNLFLEFLFVRLLCQYVTFDPSIYTVRPVIWGRWLAFPIWFCIGVLFHRLFLKVSRCRSLRLTWRSPLLIDFHALWKHVSALCQYIAIREVLQFVAVSSEQLKFLYFVIACFYLLLSYFLLFQSTIGSVIVNKKKVQWWIGTITSAK
jgi:hypothetical protein